MDLASRELVNVRNTITFWLAYLIWVWVYARITKNV